MADRWDNAHDVHVYSPNDGSQRRRQIDLDGVPMKKVTDVRVEESVDGYQVVTVTFLTTRAHVEPWGGIGIPADIERVDTDG